MSSSTRPTDISDRPAANSHSFCEKLLHQMTLDEKVGQMVQVDMSCEPEIKGLILKGKIGSLLTVRDTHVINEYQHLAVEQSRLHIPLLVGNDILHGYRTIFPIPLALSCSWDMELIERIAKTSIAEAVACGTNWNYAPMVDITRDPRWGRVAEGAGEDPCLVSEIAKAWVKGYESFHDDEGRCATACVKHFAAYGAAESGKDYNTVDMSERRLREEYIPPYHAAIQAGVKTLMTSFNDLNGLPATANPFLLKQILRKEWGFRGVIASDFDSIGELVLHGVARDLKEAALRSILAGIDIDMMSNAYRYHLVDLVREGKVPEVLIDEAVMRILNLKYELDLFNHPFVDEGKFIQVFKNEATRRLAEEAAVKSAVLLKNENNLLPLAGEAKKIALVGPLASERKSLLGCWSFDGHHEDVETLYEAMQGYLSREAGLFFNQGCAIEGEDLDSNEILKSVKAADVIIAALGESDTMSGEAHSRAQLTLPGRQMDLFNLLAQTGKPIVTLIFAGRPLTIPEVARKSSALFYVWHGGSYAARGICDLLFGKAVPSGKLSISFPVNTGQIPIYYAHKSTGRPVESTGTIQFNTAHRSIYIDESSKPLFPFGFGLGYTTFAYSDLKISNPIIEKDGNLIISVILTNTGKLPGFETVQLYVRDLVASVTRPVKELKGFQKVTLDPGENRRVEFSLPIRELSFLDENMQPTVEAGKFHVWIGPDSEQGLQGDFEVQ